MKTQEDDSVTADSPQFQVFQFRHVPSANDPPAHNQILPNNVSESPVADDIKKRNRKWTVFTQTNSGRRTVRWHEEWCVCYSRFFPEMYKDF